MASLIIFVPVASAVHDGLSRTDPGLLDLAALNRAREIAHRGNLERHREAVIHEIVEGEKAIARVLGLIAGAP